MISLLAAAAFAVSSQVTEVTVYNDRAQVTRSAAVQLEQGVNTLVFEDLPESIDSRGIQVTGAGGALVLDVRFKTENFEALPDEAWKKLDDRRTELRKQKAVIEQEIARHKEAKAFLKNISRKVTHASDSEEGAVSLDPGSWESMLALYTTKNAEYDQALQDAGERLTEVQNALAKVEADIRDAGMIGRKRRRVVEVDLDSPTAGNAQVNLSYRVRGPKWIPTYDIRVDTESRVMDVHYSALVRQNTGEDWSGVALQLSTANPGLGGQHPELDPWRISMQQPERFERMMYSAEPPSEMMLESSLGLMDADEDAVYRGEVSDLPLEYRTAAVSSKGASVVFEVEGASDVESDNVEHRVSLASVRLPAAFRYSAIPKLSPYAYLKAKAVNSGEHPFLAGKANVFLDGNFVTASQLELTAPQEEFWVFLGADESMKVEHRLIRKYQSKEGLTGKTARHAFEYLMTVKNTHSVAEEVVVWDQLPISGSEGLKVKLLQPKYSLDTAELKIDDEKKIRWFRMLKPGEEWEIPFSFYVEASRGVNISGLE